MLEEIVQPARSPPATRVVPRGLLPAEGAASRCRSPRQVVQCVSAQSPLLRSQNGSIALVDEMSYGLPDAAEGRPPPLSYPQREVAVCSSVVRSWQGGSAQRRGQAAGVRQWRA